MESIKEYITDDDNSTITFRHNFNKPLEGKYYDLVSDYENIHFGALKIPKFNQSLNNLPKGIKTIKFYTLNEFVEGYNPDAFNQPINCLPSTLEKLYLGNKFNQPLDSLPLGLKKLSTGYCFMHSLDYLPSGLEYLKIGYGYPHPLDNLPNELKTLKIGKGFNYELNNLPKSLEELIVPPSYANTYSLKHLPKSVNIYLY